MVAGQNASKPPEGLVIIPNFVSATEEKELVAELLRKDAPWLDKSHLKFSNTHQQEYGACISDAMAVIEDAKYVRMPPKSSKMVARIVAEAAKCGIADADGLAREGTKFLRVNHYNAPTGGYMHKHMDSHKCFGPVIACCSLLADTSMNFYDTQGNSFGMARVHQTAVAEIPRRSLYFMTGPSRFQWQHGIRKDQCPAERLSLTFRSVRDDAPRVRQASSPVPRASGAHGVSPLKVQVEQKASRSLLKRPASKQKPALPPAKRRRAIE